MLFWKEELNPGQSSHRSQPVVSWLPLLAERTSQTSRGGQVKYCHVAKIAQSKLLLFC